MRGALKKIRECTNRAAQRGREALNAPLGPSVNGELNKV